MSCILDSVEYLISNISWSLEKTSFSTRKKGAFFHHLCLEVSQHQLLFRRLTATMERTDREPCPYRIIDDAGGAFLFGKIKISKIGNFLFPSSNETNSSLSFQVLLVVPFGTQSVEHVMLLMAIGFPKRLLVQRLVSQC